MIDSVVFFISQALGMSGQHFTTIIVGVILFFLLFIDFGIILKNFSAFSSWVAWIIAFGLCVLLTTTGLIGIIALFFIGLVGYIGAALILVGIKVFFTVIELSISNKLKKDKEKERKVKEEIGRKASEKIGESLTKKSK